MAVGAPCCSKERCGPAISSTSRHPDRHRAPSDIARKRHDSIHLAHPAWAACFIIYCLQTTLAQTPLSPRAERCQTFARANCAHCHSIDKVGPTPLAIAPPFRTLDQRYPVEVLEEALAGGIVTGHANMPEFRLEPDQIGMPS